MHRPKCIWLKPMINCRISITVHHTHAHMHTISGCMSNQSTQALYTHRERENISNVCSRHNINRICQTRKIHQSATHLFNHRSISRHQFIAFAFIVDQTATQSKWDGRESKSSSVCIVSHTGNIVAACFYDVYAYLCRVCVCECVLSYSLVLFYHRHSHRHLSMLSLWRQHIQ